MDTVKIRNLYGNSYLFVVTFCQRYTGTWSCGTTTIPQSSVPLCLPMPPIPPSSLLLIPFFLLSTPSPPSFLQHSYKCLQLLQAFHLLALQVQDLG